jgi:hypothetical protein
MGSKEKMDTCEGGEKPGNSVKVRLEVYVIKMGGELRVMVGYNLPKTGKIPW